MLRETAEGYYKQGYNCAEAMLRAINMAWGLRLSDESLRLAAGFGGGMGCEDACGAMTGAVAGLSALLVKDKAHATPGFGALCAQWVARSGQQPLRRSQAYHENAGDRLPGDGDPCRRQLSDLYAGA